ncbi:MAG: PDDEXK nuclease domain-containing protein [Opitutaceae bacterium]|jgi:predicted nuclease of restriction endonuclease-like (RecB) superfamily|nr:PDDEXK nuclease domain-containing protein [Opitutaceae bacterium]
MKNTLSRIKPVPLPIAVPAPRYDALLEKISGAFATGQRRVAQAVNTGIVETYWNIGRHIVEFEQKGDIHSEYGSKLLDRLSRDLKFRNGKGFSRSNLVYMRLLYIRYPIGQTLSDQLSWSHYIELLGIDDPLERGFYEKQCLLENWSFRELQRQKKTSLFLRFAAGKNKKEILQLAKKGNIIESPADVLRSPYVFEFLNMPEPAALSETEIENRLCNDLASFLLELGKGFAFVKRQYRITLDNRHYHVDLVFYHRILRCFVLVDLKTAKVQHEDIGRMNMYLGYFANEENVEGDNPPVGIILTREKDSLLVKYATYGMNSRLFVQKYQLYLPSEDELRRKIENTFRQAALEKTGAKKSRP